MLLNTIKIELKNFYKNSKSGKIPAFIYDYLFSTNIESHDSNAKKLHQSQKLL